MKTSQFVLLIFLALASLQCSTTLIVLKPKCSALNWFEKGRQDGMQGQPSNNWQLKSDDCDTMEKAQIADYVDGWNVGLSLYCTKDHGFSIAKSGQPYRKICPENYEDDFLKGFEEGLKVYIIEKETARIIAEVEGLENQLRSSKELSSSEKIKLEITIASLAKKKVSNLKILEKYNEALTR